MGTLVHGWWECKMLQPPWETVGQVLRTLGKITTGSIRSTWGIDSKELEAGKLVFTAAPPTTAKGGNGAKLINR